MALLLDETVAVARTTIETPLGVCVAMATDEKLCLFDFEECDDRLNAQIESVGGIGAHEGENDVLRSTHEQVAAFFAGEVREFDIPLAFHGTEFQQRVWRELCEIPFGETISYGELARRVGNPKGSRAVGAANGRNAIAIIVPCHRVIAADGRLHGYGGGLWRKRFLLEHERSCVAKKDTRSG